MTPPGDQAAPTVAVVGGGIAGLAAAWQLVTAGTVPAPHVVVVDPADRPGGKLVSTQFAGRTVDLAADAFVAQRPEVAELCTELGIADELVPVAASGASIWARGRLRAMPEGLVLGVPTRAWWPFLRSGILSARESLRVARDLVPPHRHRSSIIGDCAIGELVGERLGRPIVERLVDPLLGGINAGGVDELSAAAVFPVLIAAASRGGSLVRELGRVRSTAPAAGGGPAFWSLRGGTAGLADSLAAALRDRGVDFRRGRVERVTRAAPPGNGKPAWSLSVADDDGTELAAHGVVLATPAFATAHLLEPHAPIASELLCGIEHASVAVVTLSVPADAIATPLVGTGFLVPRTSTVEGRVPLTTGCTYLSRKWPRLAGGDDELVRLSVGRFGDERAGGLSDDALAEAAFGELASILGVRAGPRAAHVTRWDRAFPQYRVGHLLKVAAIERSVAELGAVSVAGATYRGVGVPACIASGRSAATTVLDALGTGSTVLGADRPGSHR